MLVSLCLGAFAWRVAGLTSQSLWRDEVDALQFASRPPAGLLAMFTRPGENGPLFFAALHPWLAVVGHSEMALRLPSALAGVLMIALTYALARRLIRAAGEQDPGERVALLAALLTAVNPYLVWYSQEAKMYTWLAVWTLSALLMFLAAVQRGGAWRWLGYLALLGIAVLHHLWAVALVPVCAAWLLALGRPYRSRWRPFLLTLALPLLPYLAVMGWWQWRLFTTAGFQTGHPFVPAGKIAGGLVVALGQGVAAAPNAAIAAGVVALLLAGSVLATGRLSRPGRAAALLWSWAALPPLVIFAVSLVKPMYAERYVIWILPALLLLLARGAVGLGRIFRPLGALALLFLLVIGLANGWRQMHTPIKADFRDAAAYVESQRGPGDALLFQIPYNRSVYEYYAGPQPAAIEGRYTNAGNSEAQVAQEMAAALDGVSGDVWLIASEEAMWDRRGLVRGWLAAHGAVADQRQFRGVEVLRYRTTSW